MKSLDRFIEEAAKSVAPKSCPPGQYYCFTDRKCKKIPNKIKMWGWTKRILELEKQNQLYSKLRKKKDFRKFDFIIDNFLEKMSIKANQPPYLFVEVKKRWLKLNEKNKFYKNLQINPANL